MVTMAHNANQKTGYKQTEVGVIPEDWDVKKLGEMGECIIGLTYQPSDVKSDGLLVLRSSNIANGELTFTDNVFVNVEVPNKLIVLKDDILICVRNGSRNLIGKCVLIDDRAKGMTFGAFMSIFRTDYAHFVFYQFQSELIKRQIHENIGATINQITNKNLNSFQIPFPKEERERHVIATALSDVDALIASLDKLIAKKRAIKQATMQQLLTGKRRLPGFSGDGSAKLGDFFELNPSKISLNNTDLVTFMGMEDISENGNIINQNVMPFSSIKKGLTFFERNDVLVAKITPCFENGKGACLDTLKTRAGFGSTEFHVLR